MSFSVTIAGTPITLPSSGESPNWAPGWIAFAQAVEAALLAAVGPFDVSPQVVNIDGDNGATDVNIDALAFSTADVRAAEIYYSTQRETSMDNTSESGKLRISYNSTTMAWDMSRQIFTGKYEDSNDDFYITFSITSSGQVRFSTNTMTGTGHTGTLSIYARALPQEN